MSLHPSDRWRRRRYVFDLSVSKCVLGQRHSVFRLACRRLIARIVLFQWLRVHWARLGRGPTFSPPGGARSGLVQLLEQCFTSCCGKLIVRKRNIKIVATRCHILRLKCTKFDFGWGSVPDPTGGAYSAPPDP